MQLPIKKKTPYLGLLLSFSLILSYIESLIPFNFAIPGIKIGLSNFSVVLCLYIFSPIDAMLISLTKAVLSSLLFGNFSTLIYSTAGALLSCLLMILLKKIRLIHIISVSAIGGVTHNIAQLFVAYMIIRSNGVLYYLPYLIFSGLVFGSLLGFIVNLIIPYIKKVIYKGEL